MRLWRLLLVVLLVWPISAGAADLVSGRYITGVGDEIKIELEIAAPAPPLVIVIQHLPAGTRVVGSSPELKKYDSDKGEAKWLLSEVAPGTMTVSLQLDRAVGAGELRGEIRCRNSDGKMVSIALKN